MALFRIAILTAIVLPLNQQVLADDPTAPTSRELAVRTLAVIDDVAEHYILTPPRQELVRLSIANLRQAAKLEPQLDLGRRLSPLVTRNELLELVEQEWEPILAALSANDPEGDPNAVLSQTVAQFLSRLPGNNWLSGSTEHTVNEQLAANRYVGTGIQLTGGGEPGHPVMSKVFEAGPAKRAGAMDGDRILEIDGVATKGQSLSDTVTALRGPADSDVEVLLQQKDEEPRRYTITRGVVPITHTQVERREVGDKAVDVIRFDRITSSTVSDLRKVEQEWESPPAVILIDLQLRDFDLHRAVLLADALLDGGVIGQLESHGTHTRRFDAGRDVVFRDVPLFVLVSQATVGTPEWVAAALQDNARATIIGEQTPGQPFVHDAYEVPDTDWVLTLASGVLRRGDGRSLLHSRIAPGVPSAVSSPRGHRPTSNRQPKHDGGVMPVRTVSQPSTPRQPTFPPIPVDSALKVIAPLVDPPKLLPAKAE